MIESIEDFWQGIPLDSTLLTLDADQITSIWTYVILKSNVSDLLGQLRLLEEFTSSEVQNGKQGHAFFALKAAAEYLAASDLVLVSYYESDNNLLMSSARPSGYQNLASSNKHGTLGTSC